MTVTSTLNITASPAPVSTGNLRLHNGILISLDWATLGLSPVGFDIAQLALATLDDSIVGDYLDRLQGRYGTDAVHHGVPRRRRLGWYEPRSLDGKLLDPATARLPRLRPHARALTSRRH
jgi:hypothetical protein